MRVAGTNVPLAMILCPPHGSEPTLRTCDPDTALYLPGLVSPVLVVLRRCQRRVTLGALRLWSCDFARGGAVV